MRIALVHSFYSSAVPSGENVTVESQATALRNAGHEVVIIAQHTDVAQKVAGYQLKTAVRVLTGRGRSPMEQITAFAPDVVHVHNLFPNWGTSWLDELAVPLVATMHNFRAVCAAGTLFREGHDCTLCPDSGSHNAIIHSCYHGSKIATIPLAVRTRGGVRTDAVLNRADRVVTLSSRSAATFERYGLPREKTVVIPNFSRDPGGSVPHLQDSGWIYIGRLSSEKGILNLLPHWPANQRLTIYGDGPDREAVERLATGNIAYLGPVENSRVATILDASRGLIFPSEWQEGAPMIYVEALASGRPVIARSGNSVADDIVESRTGGVFSNWDELAELVQWDFEARAGFAARARDRFESTFTESTWLEKIMAVYDEVSARGVA